jgi:hypothetical protein
MNSKWYKDWIVWLMLFIASPFLFIAGFMLYDTIYLFLTGNYPNPPLGG